MISIENKLVSDAVIQDQFVCDLSSCKGGCCEDGDAGAPLEVEELDELIKYYPAIKKYLTPEGIKVIETQGKYLFDSEFGWVTPTIKGKMCSYGRVDENGIIKCGIEQAFNAGEINWKKPISCHLFPIRIKKSKLNPDTDYVNYEPRTDLCKAACKLGKKLKVPVYLFLKDAIIRKYGEDFYAALEATAAHFDETSV